MKKRWTLSEIARWIIILLLACLINACGTQEGTESLQTDEGAKPAVNTNTPTQTNTPSPLPTSTILPEMPTSSNPSIVPHFTPGETVTITEIYMFDALSGWAIGKDEVNSIDHILNSTDGGYTWSDVTPDEPRLQEINEFTYKHAYISPLDGERASVIYDPGEYGDPARIWSTSSAGKAWDALIINTNFQVVDALTFSDQAHGWLMLGVDAGMGHAWIELYRIDVESQEWELIIDPYSEASADLHYCCKTGMVFINSDTGLVTFGSGPVGGALIDWTDDGGLTWDSHPLPRPDDAFAELGDADYGILCESHSPILFSPRSGKVALECWADFEALDTISFIFTTMDGGSTWESEAYPGGQLLFLTPNIGWALDKDIFQTQDGGQTWLQLSTVQWEGQFSFVNQQLGWAAAQYEEAYSLLHTEDGGITWDIITPVTAN